jgi:lipoate-protein ligase A
VVRLLDQTLSSPEENLALDEALLMQLESALDEEREPLPCETLRLWESPVPFVTLGAGSRARDEVDRELCHADGLPLLRRCSGGGTVVLGPGCLNFTLILSLELRPELRDVRASYDRLLGALAGSIALEGLGRAGPSDLAYHGRKFSGNAQLRKRSSLLHHGTILYGFNLGLVDRYLPVPRLIPQYRRGRSHRDFLCNLPWNVQQVRAALARAFEANDASGAELPEYSRLVAEKYAQSSWIERR